jgi:hypothetical protein
MQIIGTRRTSGSRSVDDDHVIITLNGGRRYRHFCRYSHHPALIAEMILGLWVEAQNGLDIADLRYSHINNLLQPINGVATLLT